MSIVNMNMNLNELLGATSVSAMTFVAKGDVRATSAQVAEFFGKRHDNVLRDIAALKEKGLSNEFWRLNFEGSDYIDERGKSQPMITMTKDGFVMAAMGYTGGKAMAFKEAYIKEFNRQATIVKGMEDLRLQIAAEHKYYLAHPDLVEMDD